MSAARPDESAPSADMLRQIFDVSPGPMLVVDTEGVVQLANAQACKLFGYDAAELIGQSVDCLVPTRFRREHPMRRRSYFDAPSARPVGEGRDLHGQRRDGTEVPIEIGLSPLRTADGLFALAAIVDISARRRGEELLRTALRDKDVLLREVDHRAKDCLQVVSSLLSLQAGVTDEPHQRQVLERCRSRLRVIALMHEQLASSGNMAQIDGGAYVRELVPLLTRAFRRGDCAVRTEVHVAPLPLDARVAVPLGLILHELIANAMQHAFRDRAEGRLTVRLAEVEDGRALFEISDDGHGLPPHVDVVTSRGLGLRMIQALVRQLDGDLAVRRSDGTSIAVRFARTSTSNSAVLRTPPTQE